MPRSLADGHTTLVLCTTSPANPAVPTAAELAAGINASDRVLASDFLAGATDSDKVAEKTLAQINNANALGAGNYQFAITAFRYFNAVTGVADPAGDLVHNAVKVKGTELWVYVRRTGKAASVAMTSGDELFFAAHVIVDNVQPPSDLGGYIKERVPTEVQDAYPNAAVA